ncbi:asparaginase domain-containing protein [Quadrisphaera setariae]|uniref:asparaginase n=1 Tax=Quadrisphaera setariae TaxID=2593304 RepID=A0A5C8ZIW9_9ACTN|nr:asparaginase domain-containing protein [Quadrisphaera setariae]TXR56820.1 asparaginase [Quadrisphaera setariae]
MTPSAGGRPARALVAVVTTGGTIASTTGEDGVSRPTLSGEGVLGDAAQRAGVEVRVVEALRVDSSTTTLPQADAVRAAVADALTDPAVVGVVVVHGTDSLEETGYLLDLHHDDERPVVVTGSQRTADAPASDAPANLLAALVAAADPVHRGAGVLVAFGGALLPVAGTTKRHTTDLAAFAPAAAPLPRTAPLTPAAAPVPWPRVDVVAVVPGDDGAVLRAVLGLGARGVVLQALGSGNATAAVVTAVRGATAGGVPVVLTTRVPDGTVVPSYGDGGGGADLVAAGAVPAGLLRAGQARVLLAALLRGTPAGSAEGSVDVLALVAEQFRRRGAPALR